MTPQQNFEIGNWMGPQRNVANWNQPTVTANQQQQIPQWLQNLVAAYSQQQPANQPMAQTQYQPQQQAQQQTQPSLIGKHINNLSEIKPIEIPMDGTATYFPTVDGSSIYLRYWDQDGQIKGVRYIPEVAENEVASTSPQPDVVKEITDAITPKIDDLVTRIYAIETILSAAVNPTASTTRGNSKPKKEAQSDA